MLAGTLQPGIPGQSTDLGYLQEEPDAGKPLSGSVRAKAEWLNYSTNLFRGVIFRLAKNQGGCPWVFSLQAEKL